MQVDNNHLVNAMGEYYKKFNLNFIVSSHGYYAQVTGRGGLVIPEGGLNSLETPREHTFLQGRSSCTTPQHFNTFFRV